MVTRIRDMEMREDGRAEGIEQGMKQGIEQERVESIRSVMDSLKVGAQKAMDILKIADADRPRYTALL